MARYLITGIAGFIGSTLAHALVEERQRCLEAGMNDHVTKPIDPDALFATLKRWATPRETRVAGSARKPPRAADDVRLPDIEGLDMAGGLERVAGNKRLYSDLLVEFATKRSDVGAQISTALASGDRESAERNAHTVKGVAGNLGMNAIFQLAGKLETAIPESRADVQVLLNEFVSELDRQVQSILRALKTETPVQQEREGKDRFNPAAALAVVARLRVLLEANDANASKAYVSLRDLLRGTVDETRMDALGEAIGVFDFEAALVRLDEIARGFGGDRK